MRNIISVDLENINEIFLPCRACVYWQTSKKAKPPYQPTDGSLQKEEWFSSTLLQWGNCAHILQVDEKIVGFAQFGVANLFSRSFTFDSGTVHSKAAFLACLYIVSEEREQKYGRYLLRSIVKECSLMGFDALETYGKRFSRSNNDFDERTVDFYKSEGFRIVEDDPIYPRMRLDLKNTIVWSEEISKAIQNINPILLRRRPLPAQI